MTSRLHLARANVEQVRSWNSLSLASVLFPALGAVWLALIAALVWRHASASEWPPIYDTYTYFLKAKNFWALVGNDGAGVLDLIAVEPSFRPIGTVLMSYPFGFSADFRGFYFRSTFMPIACVCFAGFIGAWTARPSRRYRMLTALTACFLSTLSLFFYFELYDGGPPAISYWGLVDGFLTGLASVAMAAGTRSVLRGSTGWAVTGTLVSLIVIFVKPSGLPIAAACGGILGLGWLWRVRSEWSTGHRETIRQASTIFVIEIVVLGGGAMLAFHSAYLSPENLTYGNAAIDVMRAELHIDWSTQIRIAKAGLGPFVLAWMLAMAATWIVVRARRATSPARLPATQSDHFLLLLGLMTLIGGLWFWIFGSGGRTLVRYFAPFLYVAIFSALPALLKTLDDAPAIARLAVCVLMVGTMANLVALLVAPNPSLEWQMQSGVNVKSGTRPASIGQAKDLLNASHAPNSSVITIYSFTEGIADAMFQSVFDRHALQVQTPRYIVRRPFDWQRPTAYRIEEILSSDYILSDPSMKVSSLPLNVKTLWEERQAFNTWASQLTPDEGVAQVSAGRDALLLQIVDAAKLRVALESFVAKHHWRDVFVAQNVARWWSDEQISAERIGDATTLDDVDFGSLVEVRRIVVLAGADGSMQLDVWLHPDPKFVGDDWAMLVHLLDDKGITIANRDVPLGRLETAPDARPYQLLRLKLAPTAKVRTIAIGFYRGTTLLKANKGNTDWDRRRLLLTRPRAVS